MLGWHCWQLKNGLGANFIIAISVNRCDEFVAGAFQHAPGFTPGVLTIHSRVMVIIPRVELGGIE